MQTNIITMQGVIEGDTWLDESKENSFGSYLNIGNSNISKRYCELYDFENYSNLLLNIAENNFSETQNHVPIPSIRIGPDFQVDFNRINEFNDDFECGELVSLPHQTKPKRERSSELDDEEIFSFENRSPKKKTCYSRNESLSSSNSMDQCDSPMFSDMSYSGEHAYHSFTNNEDNQYIFSFL